MNFEILDNHNIKYIVDYKRVKRMRLRFNKEAILVITYPLGCKQTSVNDFVEKNLNWILKNYELNRNKQLDYSNGGNQYVFGKRCQLIINYSRTRRVDLIDDKILVSMNYNDDVQKVLFEWRMKLAEIAFNEILYKCFSQMTNSIKQYPKLVIKRSKTKWGCCYIKENKIMLNISLSQTPVKLIEYVVFHELCHFIHPNHSKEFHNLLQKYIPNERIISKELKKYQCYI